VSPNPAGCGVGEPVDGFRQHGAHIEVHVQTRRGQTAATVWGSAIETASGTIFPAGK
jgi:hypothetical protein